MYFLATIDSIIIATTAVLGQSSSASKSYSAVQVPTVARLCEKPDGLREPKVYQIGEWFNSTFCTSNQQLTSMYCKADHVRGASWTTVDVRDCPENKVLWNISKVEVTTENANAVLTDTIKVINVSSFGVAVADIEYTSQIVKNVVELVDGNTSNVNATQVTQLVQAIPTIINSILMAPSQSILASNLSSTITRTLERLLDFTAATLPENGTNTITKVAENIAIQVTSDPEVLGIQVLTSGAMSEGTVRSIKAEENVTSRNIRAQIVLSSVVKGLKRSFVVYNNARLFQGTKMSPQTHTILSAHLSKLLEYPDLIRASFSLKEWNEEDTVRQTLECGYWNYSENEWSTYGCMVVDATNSTVTCSCNHTTNLAVLVRIPESKTPHEVHTIILGVLTSTGLSVSVALLIIVLVTFLLFRKLRRTVSQKTLFSLSLSIFFLDVIFLLGIDKTGNRRACVAVSASLHYFVLTSLAWTAAEAVLQYLRFVKVLGAYIPRFMIKASIPAWGIPAIVVGAILVSDSELYYTGDKGLCWVKEDIIYYGVLLPLAFITVFNASMFTIIIRSLVSSKKETLRSNKSESAAMRLHLRAAIAVFVVMGLTWTFAFFAIGEASLLFQYLFCIFNSAQGALIAILHSLREKTVQREWRKLVCKYRRNASLDDSISSTKMTSLSGSSHRKR